MSMFIFPFGFYMVHFFYTYSVAIWGTNFSLHETEFVPFTNSLGTWAGAFQWKENWWYFTYCDDLCDANPSARGSSWAGWGGSFPWSSCQQASHWCFLHPDPLNTLHGSSSSQAAQVLFKPVAQTWFPHHRILHFWLYLFNKLFN